ncbi:MAG TPA: HAMP domain-containing sensor histidine kinase [Thermoanaerobaculia bacterium]|nr:HAMP domain-containing sensor histidine kinase [Thermoanaerobaculia bacterium]
MDSLLDTAPCGFVAFADDGTMHAVNTTLAELLGFTRLELEGWHLEKILFPGARIFYQTHVFPMLKMHGRVDEIYLALRTKDGRDVPMLMNGVRRERNGSPVNDCVFVRMIQRSEYEEQLLAARRMAEQANAAKASFLSMMSHDLRTPLTSITGHASLMAQGITKSEEERRYSVERIQDAARELLRMITDILNFAQVEAGRLEVHPVAVPVRAAVARAESLVRLRMREQGLTFTADACERDAAVMADPDRLQQILLNLLTNAIKFTPAGGSIAVGCESNGERMRILVRDSGIGIDAAQLQRVFEPFVQLDPTGADRGVGLGLAISRDLARAMDGELTAESESGQGSVFIVDLPRAADRG